LKVFLIRHADADAEVPEGLGDESRALTARARALAAQHFTDLADRIRPCDLILTSPLVRCVQTAQIFCTALEHQGTLRAHRSLLPDMPVGAIDTLVAQHDGENVVLVGHQPSMAAVAAVLLHLPSFPKPVIPTTVIGLERAARGMPARLFLYAAPGKPALESI